MWEPRSWSLVVLNSDCTTLSPGKLLKILDSAVGIVEFWVRV